MAFPVFTANLAVGAVESGYLITEVIDGPNAIYAAEPFSAPSGMAGFADYANQAAFPTTGLVVGDAARALDTGDTFKWNGTAWIDVSPEELFATAPDAAGITAFNTTNLHVGDMVEQQDTGEIFVFDGTNLVPNAGLDRHVQHGATLPQGAAYTAYTAFDLRLYVKTDDADGTPIGTYLTDTAGTSGVWIRTN